MSESVKHRGYTIRRAHHPTAINPQRMTWDILDGERVRKSNIGSMEVAKHYIDVMIKYHYWEDRSNGIYL